MREDVIRAHAELPSVCGHIHLPLQSGSSRILKAMRRTYDRSRYLDRVATIREHLPDVALSTDIIVGFPGESEEDFEQTLEVVEQVGYDSAFTFIFSPRRGTEAATFEDGLVPHPVKVERMERLVEVVQRRARERSQRFVGRTLDVLVEGAVAQRPRPAARAHDPQQSRQLHGPRDAGGDHPGADHAGDEPDAERRGAAAGPLTLASPEPASPRRRAGMKIRAAVLEEFGAPLAVRDVDLAEPDPGEVLVRLSACGVCHTDMYTASGVDPSGYAPTVLGHEGAGVVEKVGADVTLVAPGDHVVTLFSPQCGECVHCLSPLTNLCLAIREQQNKGYLPDGTTRAVDRRRAAAAFHGHVDVRGVHGDAADRARQDRPRGPARPRLPVRVRAVDGARRGDAHGRRPARLDMRGVRCGDGRARRGGGLPPAGSRADRVRGPVAGAAASSPAARAPPTSCRADRTRSRRSWR